MLNFTIYILMASMLTIGVYGFNITLPTQNLMVRASYQSFSSIENVLLVNENRTLEKTNVKTHAQCLRKCTGHQECQSFNLGPVFNEGNIKQCHLLNTTKYEHKSLLEKKEGWVHSSVLNEFCEKEPCDNNQPCVPDYTKGTGVCQCTGYAGQFCSLKVKGELTFLTGTASMHDNRVYGHNKPAALALDGDYRQSYNDQTCAYAGPTDDSANFLFWWRMDFGQKALVKNVAVYLEMRHKWMINNYFKASIGDDASGPEGNNSPCEPLEENWQVQDKYACMEFDLIGRYLYVSAQRVSGKLGDFCICEVVVQGFYLVQDKGDEC